MDRWQDITQINDESFRWRILASTGLNELLKYGIITHEYSHTVQNVCLSERFFMSTYITCFNKRILFSNWWQGVYLHTPRPSDTLMGQWTGLDIGRSPV